MKDIKTLALQAKNRLKGLSGETSNSSKLRFIKGGGENIKIIAIEKENEKFYQKYKSVVASECLHNPLGCMMDKKIYNKLCSEMKEKYFFETLEKYKILKEKYGEECQKNLDLFA